MDSRDQRQDVVSNLVKVLRKTTRIVQIAPFAYLLFLAVYLLGEGIMPDWALQISDNLLDAPLYTTAFLLGFGRLLKLCSWFRASCFLPLTTRLERYIDSFVFQFTQGEIAVLNTVLGILFLLFIYVSFRHFFHAVSKK